MKYISNFLAKSTKLLFIFVITMLVLSGIAYLYLISQLPNVEQLKEAQLQVPLRIYSADNKLMAEFGEKHRIPVTLEQVPNQLIAAILSTEDQRFFSHPGVDALGLARAAWELLRTGTKSQGGSTITMQVARNFFLSNKKTFLRKFNEILLAIKIDYFLSKEKILELYLNKIYFGNRAYGVAAAAQVYYGKKLNELNLAQLAMLAGLPKAPSSINPIHNKKAAFKRRNHVLERMLDEEYIDETTYQKTITEPITAKYHAPTVELNAPYIAEMIRQTVYDNFGEEAYTRGLQVYTTIDSKLQRRADQALEKGLINYDKRYGYRGPLANLGLPELDALEKWTKQLKTIPTINQFQAAVIIGVASQSALAMLANDEMIQIDWPGLSWAKKQLTHGRFGHNPQLASDVLKPGDIVRVHNKAGQWYLAQLPEVEGALVSLDPNNGSIKALSGGFSYQKSKFNRAMQAMRQPGSSFKPFIYAAGLDKGLTLATVINDAPIALDDPSQQQLWRPKNASGRFYGPTRLRMGLTHSRNLVSIRLLEDIGIEHAIDFITRFGFKPESLPSTLSLALGSLSTTPIDLSAGYATFANGGYQIEPFIIDKIITTDGEIIFQAHPRIVCADCPEEQQAQRIVSPQVAYLITLALQDVIQHGTGRAAKVLKRQDLAGKTGTTNDQLDAWFAGFNGDLVTTVWIGFDQPRPLHEYSATTALPIWIDFMRQALTGKAEHSLVEPPGLVTVRIDPRTGLLANSDQETSIFETFREENLPRTNQQLSTSTTDSSEPIF